MKKPIVFNYNGIMAIADVEFPDVCPICKDEVRGQAIGETVDSKSNIIEVLIQCPACEEFYYTFHSFHPTTRKCEILNTKIMKHKKK